MIPQEDKQLTIILTALLLKCLSVTAFFVFSFSVINGDYTLFGHAAQHFKCTNDELAFAYKACFFLPVVGPAGCLRCSPPLQRWATLHECPPFFKASTRTLLFELRAEDGASVQTGGARACRLGWKEYGNVAWEMGRAEEAKAALQERGAGSRNI